MAKKKGNLIKMEIACNNVILQALIVILILLQFKMISSMDWFV